MAISNDIEQLLTDFMLNLTVDTKSNLKKKLDERAKRHNGKSVQSRLGASIKAPEATYKNGGISAKLEMNDYWEVVDKGRSANNVSSEGQDKIAEWSATRGVAEKIRLTDLESRKKKQGLSKRKDKLKTLKKMPFDRAKKAAGFLIARSLKKKNLEPTNFFSEVIKDGRIEQLYSALTVLLKTDINIEIKKA